MRQLASEWGWALSQGLQLTSAPRKASPDRGLQANAVQGRLVTITAM